MQPTLERARFNMIEQQIRPWQVLDERVLAVMGALPRELFVPADWQGLAYADIDIPLTDGAAMLAPKIVGRMLQALAVQKDDRVLEIGTGSGYLTACLAELGGPVRSLEIDPALAAAAGARLDAMGLAAVTIAVGDGLAGPAQGGPFDVIVLTGSLPSEAPLAMLRAQLTERGRLFAIVGEGSLMQALIETRVPGGGVRRTNLFETSVPALRNAPPPERFTF